VRRLLVLTAFVAAAVLGVAAPAAGSEVEIADLLADQGAYDQSEITVRGELIGDFGRRGDWVWVQVNGDSYADEPVLAGGPLTGGNLGIAARIPEGLFAEGGFGDAGGYRHRGAVVLLTGTWRFHDPDRTGESYLEVTAMQVVAPEQRLDEGPLWVPLGIGLGLLAGAWLFRRRSGKARRGGT